ncbi:MAG: hypothetical protein ABIZ52_02690 [Candidatus Limnocylindrales bacterium]
MNCATVIGEFVGHVPTGTGVGVGRGDAIDVDALTGTPVLTPGDDVGPAEQEARMSDTAITILN